MSNDKHPAMASLLAQAAHYLDRATGGVVPPLQPSTTFARDESYELMAGWLYARDASPTGAAVEEVVARIEGGADSLLFSSGVAAAAAVLETVRPGQQVVAPLVMYHGLREWMRRLADTRGIGLTLCDATSPEELAAAVRPGNTALVWVETLLNPTWDVVDVAEAARIAHAAGATLVVDATVTPPVTLRPLELGADVSFHSATKYLNGHSDVTAGVLTTRVKDARWEEIGTVRRLAGAVLGPFEAWLLLRGMRTLAVRFERASDNAMAIARRLERHPAVERVLYPGLESHPGHAVARRQMHGGFGGMLSILLRGGEEAARRVATSVKLFVPATSLGGVESLLEHRAVVEGPASTVPRNLLRVSVGIEDADDLVADLEQALGRLG